MPTIVVRRFPLPSVSIYLILSVSLLFLSIMWANNTLVEEQELLGINKSNIESQNSNSLLTPEPVDKETPEVTDTKDTTQKKTNEFAEVWSYPKPTDTKPESSITFSVKRDSKNPSDETFVGTEIAKSITAGNYSFAYGVFQLMLDEPLCLMLVVNATYCVLVVIMHIIQKIVFGKLRPVERQHMKDKFWNFVFYKFIFIFGVMNVQSLNEVLVWVSWFTAIAFLLLLTKLSKDRFEFLSFSPNTPMFYHWKVVGLLNFILLCCILLALLCVTSTFPFSSSPSASYDIHSITFMLAECVIIAVKAVHVMARYGIHLYDVRHAELWERKATVVYHVDLTMELLSLLVNFVHHLHMLFSGNIWLSMASLVICMQLRFIFSEIQKRYLRHKNYRRVVANMDAQFPAATREEIDQHEDRCAICWDQMESARKLPCGHLFHAPCLRSWLEQDTTCPTCRKQLGIRQNGQRDGEDVLPEDEGDDVDGRPGGVPNPAGGGLANAGRLPHRNHFWHFDGTRFASWLPSFSVEVTHSPHGAQAMVTTTSQINQDISTSQLDAMVRDVQDIFPQVPTRVIANDLRRTGSTEQTTLNILEGNVPVPPDQMVPAQQAPTPPENNRSDFQLPLVTRSQPFFNTTLRRRNVSSVSETQLTRAQTRTTTTTTSVNHLPGMFVQHPSNNAPLVADNTSTSSGSSHPASAAVFGRFSKAPEEREVVLRNRRDMLLRQARRKYLDRGQRKTSETDSSAAEAENVISPTTNAARRVSADALPGSSVSAHPSLDIRSGYSASTSPVFPANTTAPQSGQIENGRSNASNDEISEDPLD